MQWKEEGAGSVISMAVLTNRIGVNKLELLLRVFPAQAVTGVAGM